MENNTISEGEPAIQGSNSDATTQVSVQSVNSSLISMKTATQQLTRIQGTDILVEKPQKPKPAPLEEDEYIGALSEIIERDFFPNLKKMRMQNEFLEAVDKVDLDTARRLGAELNRAGNKRLDEDTTPFQTRAQYNLDTPTGSIISSMSDTNASKTSTKYDTNLSLDTFQARYTSEDNASFNEIMEKSAQERREKYRWVYDTEKKRLTLDRPESLLLENGEMKVNPHGFIEEWKYVAKNPLMYYPDASPMDAPVSHNRGNPKSINHHGTRYGTGTISTKSLLNTSHKGAFERAETDELWKEMAKSTPALFSNNDPLDRQSELTQYDFVPGTPLLEPGKDIDPSELMTWGEIEGTPLLLDSGIGHSSDGPSFKLPPTPRREQLGMKLSEAASRNIRKRTMGSTRDQKSWTPGADPMSKVMSTPRIRGESLSVAGKNLLKKQQGTSRSVESFGSSFGAYDVVAWMNRLARSFQSFSSKLSQSRGYSTENPSSQQPLPTPLRASKPPPPSSNADIETKMKKMHTNMIRCIASVTALGTIIFFTALKEEKIEEENIKIKDGIDRLVVAFEQRLQAMEGRIRILEEHKLQNISEKG